MSKDIVIVPQKQPPVIFLWYTLVMNIENLKILEGGLSAPINHMPKRFVSAYATNTRLMGVLAVYAHWNIAPALGLPDLHQFFYIDCEEQGLETYRSFRGDFGPEARLAEQALTGGLGAQKVPISERELHWLMSHWCSFNKKHHLPLPENREEYDFIFGGDSELSYGERRALLDKICVEISSDYQAVNYFLMRCFGRDYEGANRLTDLSVDFPLDIYDGYEKATFCKNIIDPEQHFGDGSVSYLCESLIEMGGRHETVISKVVIRNLKVIGFEHCDSYRISSREAAMMLKKPEFTSVYEFLLDEAETEENIGEFIVGLDTIMTTHSNGRLFMAFKSGNDHVSERVFMLSNDVCGVYYLTDYGQLIIMAYSVEDAALLEARLASGPLGQYIMPVARYEFPEPVFFEFINSGFEDFEDFVGV